MSAWNQQERRVDGPDRRRPAPRVPDPDRPSWRGLLVATVVAIVVVAVIVAKTAKL